MVCSIFQINLDEEIELDNIIRGVNILTDVDRLEQSMGKVITDCGQCRILYPNETKHFSKLKLEFLGFCTRTFLVGKGVLLPGNPNMGIVEWDGKYFAFNSPVAAQKFAEDPNRHISEILDFIKKRPEFIHLFQLYETIESMSNIKQNKSEPETKQRSQEIQTDVHILQPHVDKNYSSSIWEHRRRALHLARIFQSSTKSTQTIQSHFRSEVQVQVEPPKDKEVQTRTDNSMNTKYQTMNMSQIVKFRTQF